MSFEKQIISKDKYRSLLSHQMEAIVFVILQTVIFFFATRKVLNIEEYHLDITQF